MLLTRRHALRSLIAAPLAAHHARSPRNRRRVRASSSSAAGTKCSSSPSATGRRRPSARSGRGAPPTAPRFPRRCTRCFARPTTASRSTAGAGSSSRRLAAASRSSIARLAARRSLRASPTRTRSRCCRAGVSRPPRRCRTPGPATGSSIFDAATGKELASDELRSGHGAVWDDERRRVVGARRRRAARVHRRCGRRSGQAGADVRARAAQRGRPRPGRDSRLAAPVPQHRAALLLLRSRSAAALTARHARRSPDIKSYDVHPRTGRVVYIQAERPNWWAEHLHFQRPDGNCGCPASTSTRRAGPEPARPVGTPSPESRIPSPESRESYPPARTPARTKSRRVSRSDLLMRVSDGCFEMLSPGCTSISSRYRPCGTLIV